MNRLLARIPAVCFSVFFVLFFALNVQADTTFVAALEGSQEVPPNNSTATGAGTLILNSAETSVTVTLSFSGLSSAQTAAHIHGAAQRGTNAGVIFTLPNSNQFTVNFAVTAAEVADLKAGLWYFNVHTTNFPGGEIRGQIEPLCTPPAANQQPLGGVSNICSSGAVALTDSTGALDTSFDADGKLTVPLSNFEYDEARGVAVQPDGKIVIAGSVSRGFLSDIAVARFNPNGALDTTFNGTGVITTQIGLSAEAWAVAVQPTDGKIIVAGSADNGADNDFVVVRFNPNGTPDNNFGTNGVATASIGQNTDDTGYALLRQTNGKIVVGGSSAVNFGDYNFALVRFDSNGALDTASFGSNGRVTTSFGASSDEILALALKTSGEIVAAGYTDNGADTDWAIAQYGANGALDSSFSGDGKLVQQIGASYEEPYAVAVNNGKIIVAGYRSANSSYDFALARYEANGNLDGSFGGGIVTTDISGNGGDDLATSVFVQPDGKIIAAGRSTLGGTGNDFAVARYLSNGALDTSFNATGKAVTSFGSGDDQSLAAVLQPDLKILLVGFSFNGGNNDIALVRYGYGPGGTGVFDLGNNTAVKFQSVAQVGNTISTPINRNSLPALPNGAHYIPNSPAVDIRSSVAFGSVTVRFDIAGVANAQACASLRVLHYYNGAWTAEGNLPPTYNNSICTVQQNVTSLSPFVVIQATPTAASVTLGGRVTTASGRGILNARVVLTEADGTTRTVLTGAFGNYRFTDVGVGQDAMISVFSKRFDFSQPTRVIQVTEKTNSIDFTAEN